MNVMVGAIWLHTNDSRLLCVLTEREREIESVNHYYFETRVQMGKNGKNEMKKSGDYHIRTVELFRLQLKSCSPSECVE